MSSCALDKRLVGIAILASMSTMDILRLHAVQKVAVRGKAIDYALSQSLFDH